MARSKLQGELAEREAKEEQIQRQLHAAAKHPHKRKAKRDKQMSLQAILGHLKISEYRYPTVRPIEEFSSKSCNRSRQVNEFIKHAFCKYHVPRFMFGVWHLGREEKFRPWFICLAQGGSLYKEYAREVMSKAETADFVRNSDDRLHINQNIWRAKLKGMGANSNYAYSVVTSRFNDVAQFTKFWEDVARFFIKHNIPKQNLDELLDFLRNRHLDDETFSLKGRTLASITQLSNEWHEEQIRKQHKYGTVWEGMHIKPWTYITRLNHPHDKRKIERVYTIEEITNSKDLFHEGRTQGHCVGSYVRECESQRSSIFKMESIDEINGRKKHLTIQVGRQSKTVMQARGKHNAMPTPVQQDVLNAWTKYHNFSQRNLSYW